MDVKDTASGQLQAYDRPSQQTETNAKAVGIQSAIVKRRLEHIDGLRGLAILMVLITHAWVFSGAPSLVMRLFGHQIVFAAVPAVGYVGVNLFLIISGFCLAWPFARNDSYRDHMTLQQFFVRRIRRIIPAYYISIFVVVAFTFIWAKMSNTNFVWPAWSDLVWHMMFIHNLSLKYVSTINSPYWSLALEFQLYLLFPILYEAMRRWGPIQVFGICFLVQMMYRVALELMLPGEILSTYDFVLPKAMPGRMVDFVCGMVVAFGVAHKKLADVRTLSWLIPTATVFFLGGAFTATCWHVLPQSIIDVFWSFGFASLVWWSSNGGSCNRFFCYKPLVWLGITSYSVYLLHQPMIECACSLVRQYFRPGSSFIVALLLLPLVVLICFGFFWVCERRFINRFAMQDRKLINC